MWSSVTSLSRPRVENETRTIEIKPLCTRLMYIVTSWGYTVFQKRKREEFFYTSGEGVDVSTEQQQQPNATCHLLRGGYTRLENISRYRGEGYRTRAGVCLDGSKPTLDRLLINNHLPNM